MSSEHDKRRIDRKGRITIPKSIRDRLNIDPGEQVDIDIEDEAVVIRPQISREEFIQTMQGCIDDETRRESAGTLTPEDIKSDWTSDLPNSS
ncbi:AbrB/MazE/SpoVT family DNA-binding domain-containing protein [Haloarcula halophila]|uniref:AbrB/MazE/SpoVT family DNA-binding domain-containing protein n=1 Tax=Haloarcula TaxID=2237 RepID=UPI0023E39F03|nr:AbrB/MazE/SpoVT family DNA-binding domain-containing protein [Halomicroarcula sp. DFY41]